MRQYRGNAIQVIQGGQWGSESKGAVAGYLAIKENMDICVRTGATNAGHTVFWGAPEVIPVLDVVGESPATRYEKFVMQQLPCGWVNPKAFLVIGAGALIDPDILKREIDDIRERTGEDIRTRLLVDYRAHIHWPHHAKFSKDSNRHTLIGATGKGCSEALIARLRLRGVDDNTVGHLHTAISAFDGVRIGDTEEMLNRGWDGGAKIQLEGTQGQLLDLCLGPYPYVTHKQTGPAQWMLECGLSPSLPTDIVMVVRTFPIRVAGNSGPMPQEVSWVWLAQRINSRLLHHQMLPLVHPWALVEFVRAVKKATKEFDTPAGSDGTDQTQWGAGDRVKYAHALSNIHAEALKGVSVEVRDELGKLFEMTTVTKKLRRVAMLDLDTLRLSARQVRPHRLVVTFMNYVFAELWNCRGADTPMTDYEAEYLNTIADACGAGVDYFNRGALPDHFVSTE